MSEALKARADFLEALETDGSFCTIRTTVNEVSDSYGIVITPATITNEATKCFPLSEASSRMQEAINSDINISSYELSMKLYSDTEITKAQTIVFDGSEYEILYVSKKIYINEVIFYEILIKR